MELLLFNLPISQEVGQIGEAISSYHHRPFFLLLINHFHGLIFYNELMFVLFLLIMFNFLIALRVFRGYLGLLRRLWDLVKSHP